MDMPRINRSTMPVPVVAAIAVSVLAIVVLWVSPAVGLALFGAVVLAGLVLFVAGNRAAGLVVALMPLAVFLLATQVVGSLWFRPYRVPSGSMVPTIDVGDRVLADRHHPSPRVGDVVIAHPPSGALEDRCGAPQSARSAAPCGRATPGLSDVNFIKRVVAGPGDTIAFRHGLVIRNGRAADEPYARRCTDKPCELPIAITVPAGAWFLAGDDRGASDDSRFWGPVPTDAITGIVKYRYWPLKRAGRL
jgi:signal peptidase I